MYQRLYQRMYHLIRKHLIVIPALILFALPSHGWSYSLMVFGDSLSAAYGMPVEKGWVALLDQRLDSRGIPVANQSIAGETSYGGLQRISQALENTDPQLVILELGANDGLQGLDVAQMKQNLATIIQKIKDHGSEVLLFGMKIPPNYGRLYTDAFHQAYLDLSAEFEIPIVPFFLETVALDYDLMQLDGYHPNELAQSILLEYIWPTLNAVLPK